LEPDPFLTSTRSDGPRSGRQKGVPFYLALRKAWQDPVTKDRYFTTPLSLKRSRSSTDFEDPAKWAKQEGGKGKGKGKHKNKGKDKGKDKGRGRGNIDCKSKSPDGKPICYRFNTESESCAKAKCPYLHICGRCFKDQPMYRCPGIN